MRSSGSSLRDKPTESTRSQNTAVAGRRSDRLIESPTVRRLLALAPDWKAQPQATQTREPSGDWRLHLGQFTSLSVAQGCSDAPICRSHLAKLLFSISYIPIKGCPGDIQRPAN